MPRHSADLERVPVRRLKFNRDTGRHDAHQSKEKFLKGPIPLDWIARANSLPGKAGAVGIALWFLVGVCRDISFKVTAEVEKIAGCGRKSLSTSLAALGRAGLVTVVRRAGGRPHVSIIRDAGSLAGAPTAPSSRESRGPAIKTPLSATMQTSACHAATVIDSPQTLGCVTSPDPFCSKCESDKILSYTTLETSSRRVKAP